MFFRKRNPKAAKRYSFGRGLSYDDRVEFAACSRLLAEMVRGAEYGLTPEESLEALRPAKVSYRSAKEFDLFDLPILFTLFKRPGPLGIKLGYVFAGVAALFAFGLIQSGFAALLLAVPASVLAAWLAILGFVLFAFVGARVVGSIISSWGGEDRIIDSLVRFLADRVAKYRESGFTLAEALVKSSPSALAVHASLADAIEAGDLERARGQARVLADKPPYPSGFHYGLGGLLFYILLCAGIVQFVAFKVMPKFSEIFHQLGVPLPDVTQRFLDFIADPTSLSVFMVILLYMIYVATERVPWHYLYFLAPFLLMLVPYLLAALVEGEPDTLLVIAFVFLITLLFLLSGRGKSSRLLDYLDPFAWIRGLPGFRRGDILRERIEFIAALAVHDDRSVPLADLADPAFGAAVTQYTQSRASKFEKAVEQGQTLPEILENSELHPLSARQGRLLALAARGGTLPGALDVMLDDAFIDERLFHQKLEIVIRYVIYFAMGAATLFVLTALYFPIFFLPAQIAYTP